LSDCHRLSIFCIFTGCAEAIFQTEDIHDFFLRDNSTQISILEYLLFEMGVVDGISSI
jgi:hypothetical protein